MYPAGAVRDLALVTLLPLVMSGFWYAQNLILTGNPLYPLHLSALGRVCARLTAGSKSRSLSRAGPTLRGHATRHAGRGHHRRCREAAPATG